MSKEMFNEICNAEGIHRRINSVQLEEINKTHTNYFKKTKHKKIKSDFPEKNV